MRFAQPAVIADRHTGAVICSVGVDEASVIGENAGIRLISRQPLQSVVDRQVDAVERVDWPRPGVAGQP